MSESRFGLTGGNLADIPPQKIEWRRPTVEEIGGPYPDLPRVFAFGSPWPEFIAGMQERDGEAQVIS